MFRTLSGKSYTSSCIARILRPGGPTWSTEWGLRSFSAFWHVLAAFWLRSGMRPQSNETSGGSGSSKWSPGTSKLEPRTFKIAPRVPNGAAHKMHTRSAQIDNGSLHGRIRPIAQKLKMPWAPKAHGLWGCSTRILQVDFGNFEDS